MTYPTTYDMLYRKSAVARSMAFQNLNFAQATIRSLLAGEIEVEKIQEAKTLARAAIYKSTRNAESARFLGCALHRI